jgi:osmoprotectant transport system ATP-binding protein
LVEAGSPQRSEAALEARAVTKVFPGGVRALRGVDLTVASGETVALVGESGCGKTTLLRMFNRLEDPTEGTVLIEGRPAVGHDPITLRRHTGYVQQEGGLLPHWTVRRNVELVPELLGWETDRRRARGAELLDLVGLAPAEFGSRYPRKLSGGQRQRVAFARALAADPPVVLLDEPFGALDALTRLELQREFLGLKRRLAKTIVLVTHDLQEAFRLGDRIAVMREGRILQTAVPDELRRRPADDYVRSLLAMTVETEE